MSDQIINNNDFEDVSASYRNWKRWSNVQFARCSKAEMIYFQSELNCNISGKQVLELGFGNGAFLAFCSNHGAEVVGLEIDAELVARATIWLLCLSL